MEVDIYESAAFLTDNKKHSERQCVDLKGRWITEGFNISSANEKSDLPRISEIFPIFKGDHQMMMMMMMMIMCSGSTQIQTAYVLDILMERLCDIVSYLEIEVIALLESCGNISPQTCLGTQVKIQR